MLGNSTLQTIVLTENVARAEHFYTHVLGLNFVKLSHGSLVFRVNGGTLLVSPVPKTKPTEHTVVGFSIPDLALVIEQLKSLGVELERFPHLPLDERNVLNIPGGDRVAWIRDPDGNLLSLVQYAVDIN
jgi:catechol 2,3-dioxygenase-like lactoylglutathione lyase family enzyme